MNKSASSLQTKSAERSALPPGVAPDLEEILDLCDQLKGVEMTAQGRKLINRIAQVADGAAQAICATFEEVA